MSDLRNEAILSYLILSYLILYTNLYIYILYYIILYHIISYYIILYHIALILLMRLLLLLLFTESLALKAQGGHYESQVRAGAFSVAAPGCAPVGHSVPVAEVLQNNPLSCFKML